MEDWFKEELLRTFRLLFLSFIFIILVFFNGYLLRLRFYYTFSTD